MADTPDLGSGASAYGFKSHHPYHNGQRSVFEPGGALADGVSDHLR